MLFDVEPEGLEGINIAFETKITPKLRGLEDRRKRAERQGYIRFP